MAEPVFVGADVDDGDKAAGGAMKGFSRDEIFDRRVSDVRVKIKIQNFFPHGNQKTEVMLLAGVFLCDLKLNGFVCFLQSAEQGGSGFAGLKVDGAVLDLNDDVVVELAVERMKNVVSGFGPIVFKIAPIEMMVVDESA